MVVSFVVVVAAEEWWWGWVAVAVAVVVVVQRGVRNEHGVESAEGVACLIVCVIVAGAHCELPRMRPRAPL